MNLQQDKPKEAEGKPVEIRAALIPPMFMKRLPGYLLVMKVADGKLKFVHEYQDQNPRQFIENVIEIEEKYRYHRLYTTLNLNENLVDTFFINLYRTFRESMPWISVVPAPYANDVKQGIDMFSALVYDSAFEAPPDDSILYSQLNIQADIEPDEDYYAFHALRYILGGLLLQKHIDADSIAVSRREWTKAKESVNLTGMSLAAHKNLQRIKKQNKERYGDEELL